MAPAAVLPSYCPSEWEAKRFWSAESSRERVHVDVPHGFPKKIESSLAWTPAEIEKQQSKWMIELTTEDTTAIEAALVEFEANYEDLSSISASTFQLPAPLSQRLKAICDGLYDGVGFQIIRGLDPANYTARQNIILYAGIGSHICPERGFVDRWGNVITHIVNVQGEDTNAEPTSPAFGRTPLSFHTDNCEIMAFYYLDTAAQGGQTLLSSSWQIYNDLAAKRPEVLQTLSEPWWMDSLKPYEHHPPRHWRLLQRTDPDKVLFRFSRYGVTGWQRKRNPGLPEPTQAQVDALDAVSFTAMKNAFTLPTARGDLLFVNDMALMHARESFDEGGVYLKRHILKMFFRDPEKNWKYPPSMVEESMWKYSPNQPDGTRKEGWRIEHRRGYEAGPEDNG